MEANIDFLEVERDKYIVFGNGEVIKKFSRDEDGRLSIEISPTTQVGDEQVITEGLDSFELVLYAQETEVFFDGKRQKMSDLLRYYGILSE